MAYQKKYATEEERHAARVASGKVAGKKSVEVRRRSNSAKPATMIRVRIDDKKILDKAAKNLGISTTELLHQISDTLIQKHPQWYQDEIAEKELTSTR